MSLSRRDFLYFGGLGAMLIASSCAPSAEYIESVIGEIEERKREKINPHIDGVLENIVDLQTITEYEPPLEEEENFPIKEQGIIFGNYIITLDHIISSSKSYSTYGPFVLPITKTEEITYLTGQNKEETMREQLEKILSDPNRDIAILKLPESFKKPEYKVQLGDSDRLKIGDRIYIIGDPGNDLFVPRKGEVLTDLQAFKTSFENGPRPIPGYAFFPHVMPGESGSPVLNEDGKIVGIVESTTISYSVMVPINSFRNEIAKYESSLELKNNGEKK
jgi:serine protease Do